MVINMKKRALWKSKIRAKLYPVFSRFSMKTQLIALVSITFTLIIAVIITYNYRSNRNAITVQQTQSASTLLNLESQNLDAYFTEISRYSLLLRHDA